MATKKSRSTRSKTPILKSVKVMPSVKVMRSYDYCHFEVALSSDQPMTPAEINDLRKEAALLVDEAIRQYRIAKEKESKRQSNEYHVRLTLERLTDIEKKPKSEWTPEEAALMRHKEDNDFWKAWDDDDYGYCDPDREYHFSMLRHFDGVAVKG